MSEDLLPDMVLLMSVTLVVLPLEMPPPSLCGPVAVFPEIVLLVIVSSPALVMPPPSPSDPAAVLLAIVLLVIVSLLAVKL